MRFRMLIRGGTRGAVTGRNYVYRPGQTIKAAEGDFRHLRRDAYEVIETATAVPRREVAASPGLTKHAKGGGWWEVRRGDEVVFEGRKADVDRFLKE